jgi:5'-nucleotidase
MATTFTILHTNDIHSNLIGVGPAAEYTPATLNDDRTIGGIERIATLIAERREADGPVCPACVFATIPLDRRTTR